MLFYWDFLVLRLLNKGMWNKLENVYIRRKKCHRGVFLQCSEITRETEKEIVHHFFTLSTVRHSLGTWLRKLIHTGFLKDASEIFYPLKMRLYSLESKRGEMLKRWDWESTRGGRGSKCKGDDDEGGSVRRILLRDKETESTQEKVASHGLNGEVGRKWKWTSYISK